MATVRHLGLFPWCVPRSVAELATYASARSGLNLSSITELLPPGAGSLWPVALSLEKTLELYWRVKKLKIEAPLDSVFATGQIVPQASSEKDLVCLPAFPLQTFISAFSQMSGGLDQGRMSIDWDFLLYDESINKFHIPLRADFAKFNGIGIADGFSYTDYAENPGAGAVFGGSIDFLGEELPLGESTLSTCGTSGTERCAVYAAGTITVEEYWPYDPEDGGGPIYDSVTGAQLRDFPAS
jgi:hypothetical protein